MIRILLIVLLLAGCAHNSNIIKTTTDNAKENIDTIISLKPECKDVGDACKRELDNIERMCIQTVEKEKDNSWKRGFKSGITFTGVILILLFMALKRVKI